MLVEDIDRLDLIERQKDLSEILRGIELSADEEAEVERMSAAGFDPTLFEVSAA